MPDSVLVNDLHSALNPTRVARVLHPVGREQISAAIRDARSSGASLALSGGRHAMGGQQFATDQWLLDLRAHAAIHGFDAERGLLTVDAGIQWPALMTACAALPAAPDGARWGIRQKQTGADRLTLGGGGAAGVHGRGGRLPPRGGDGEAFTLICPDAVPRRCARDENPDLFRLAIGGYGLFGVIADVTLRLAPRVPVRRSVEIITLEELVRVPAERDTSDWLYGDFQYSIDERSPDFLHRGVFSAYRRCEEPPDETAPQLQLNEADWIDLLALAHTDRAKVFDVYSGYYLSTHGQRYWSDTHQLSIYPDDYHSVLDRRFGSPCRCSEMISELYVPRPALGEFMSRAADYLRASGVPVIYGTIRLIERDNETVLAWAREPWACIIFNLHCEHTPSGLDHAAAGFRSLLDIALSLGGSYYLTYHRWATRAQVETAHPRFREFLAEKQTRDPTGLFTSDWYHHHQALFATPA
ncbi:MAG: FAD-binding oxidoreductase [Burkholderiales bacterium]|nr:FAD-binding oxidoreductase [Opitutaceae bacterium]